jgi:hypothetical protein
MALETLFIVAALVDPLLALSLASTIPSLLERPCIGTSEKSGETPLLDLPANCCWFGLASAKGGIVNYVAKEFSCKWNGWEASGTAALCYV